ncbi:BppU family phage baseplate upper protein [Clostridium perfringens]
MKEIIVNVDNYNENSIKTIEGDNLSEVYKIYICKNKRRIDLTNKIAIMAYVNEYGNKKSNILALNITNASQGEIELPITNVISSENGVYACQIAIYGENNSLEQTAPFSLIVENNIFSKISNTAINSSDFHILSEAIKTTNAYGEKLKEGTENIELQYADKLNEILPQVRSSLDKSNDAIGKANNPLGSMQSNGQKIPYDMLDEDTKKAISGTTSITTNAGFDKNRGVDYPLKPITRDGILSQTSDKIKNGILNIKIYGAKINKYYRLEWLGNGVVLNNGKRYDVLISEYDKETYSYNSTKNKLNLINLDDSLGKDNPPSDTTIATVLYSSPSENISIELTYDRSVIGDSLALNNPIGDGYSFIIDESCYKYNQNDLPINNPPMYVRKRGDELTFAWKYDSEHDINLFINRFSSNKLMLLGFIGLKPNSNPYVSKKIGEPNLNSLIQLCPQLTDNISPYIMKAVNNGDGDKENSQYEFVGGCHNYNNSADNNSTPTARLVKYDLFVDGELINKDGIYSCNSKAKIICKNRIQANNTKKVDGSGREVLEENVIYDIEPSKVTISNEITALEDIVISRNYGLQSYISEYTKNNGYINYINGKQYSPYPFPIGGNSGCKTDGAECNAIEVYNDNYYMKIEMEDIGLTKRREINDSDNLAFFSNSKTYFYLINKNINLSKNGKLYYRGNYTFLPRY